MTVDGFPGHEVRIGLRLPDGSLAETSDDPVRPVGYRAMCSCGWTGEEDHPPGEEGSWLVSSEWGQHMRPIWATSPPSWLLNRAEGLRDDLTELSGAWPLQALGVLAEIDRWQRPLLDQAVIAARAAGSSWSEIGKALGVTRQSAHERFRTVVREQAG